MIKRLDLETASRIRGGTVIESPGSAVQALVQNSMDAGARKIDVKLHLGTLSLCVEDDGHGMTGEELDVVGSSYFLSKGDMARGESLSALVSSCSNVVILTRRKQDNGWNKRSFRSENKLEVLTLERFFEPQYSSNGTVVMATRLFGSTPVRWEIAMRNHKNMMESIKIKVFELLAHRIDVRVRLFVNDGQEGFRKIADTGECDDLTDAYSALFGKRDFQTIEGAENGLRVTMFISLEPIQSSRHQFVFLNRRPVYLRGSERRGISNCILKFQYTSVKGYFGKSVKGYPSFIVLLRSKDQDNGLDCHATKAIQGSILRLLSRSSGSQSVPETPRKRVRLTSPYGPDSPLSLLNASPESAPDTPRLSQITNQVFLDDYQIVSQVSSRFILFVNRATLYVVDQHACDERIRYEQVLRDFLRDIQDPFIDMRVKCDDPPILDINPKDLTIFGKHRQYLLAYGIGFTIQGNRIHVTHLPAILMPKAKDTSSLKSFMIGWISDLEERNIEISPSQDWFMAIQQIPAPIRDSLITKSCKDAIKFGEQLTLQEMYHLMNELSKCRLFTQCAHGRPTIVPVGGIENFEGFEPFWDDYSL